MFQFPKIKFGTAILGALLMTGGGFLSYYVQTQGSGPTFPTMPSLSFAAVQAPVQAVEQMLVPNATAVFGKQNLHVLVVGLDYDYNDKDEETSKQSRSDIIMALNLDFKRKRISELSIPRDMVATMPNGQRAKINEAQSEGGINESEKVVSSWLNLPTGFDRYIVLRIDTAKDLIDAIGGIDINVQNSSAIRKVGANGPLNYDDNWGHLHVHLQPGMQHLNGENAVGYGRFRHDWCSDPCRIMRQQQIMRAVAQKMEHDRLNTITHFQQILAVVHKDIDTNFTGKEELVAAWPFSKLKVSDIHTAQVPYVDSVMLPDYGDSLIPDEVAKRQLVAAYFPPDVPDATAVASSVVGSTAGASSGDASTAGASSDVATTAGASSGTASTAVASTDEATQAAPIHVRVENGTATPGLAGRVAAQLRQKGFVVDDVSDAQSDTFQTTEIHFDSTNQDASLRVRDALGQNAAAANIMPTDPNDTTAAVGVTVVLGRDILGSTTP